MSDIISALLSAEQQDPNSAEAMALADQLRGNMRNADFLSLSTVEPISRLGQTTRQATQNAAESRGRLNRTIAAEQRALERQKDQEARALKRTLATEQREEERYRRQLDDTRTQRMYTDRNGDIVTLDRDGTGQLFLQGDSADGQPLTRDDIEFMQLQPYDPAKGGAGRLGISARKYDDEQLKEMKNTLLSADFISSTMKDPLMQAATGSWYDIPKLLAKYTGLNPEVQSVNNELAQITAEAAAPLLSTLGVNPTDKDLQVAFGTVPKDTDQPQVWFDWYRDRYAPRLRMMVGRDNPQLLPMIEARIADTLQAMEGNIEFNRSEGMTSLAQQTRKTVRRSELEEFGLSEAEAIDAGYRVTN